jgi:hypothetical protein
MRSPPLRIAVTPIDVPARLALKRARYPVARAGYFAAVRTDDDTRSVEQEVAAGQSETTPLAVITSVAGIVAILFLLVLGLAALAYFLA